MAAMSWNSSIEKPLRPTGTAMRWRSCSRPTTMAVLESAIARPPTSAACQVQPISRPSGNSSAAQSSICSVPPPNTAARMAHRRLGSSSSPMTKSISTTPSSDTCRMAAGSLTSAKPTGPITMPATR
ncbi:hypothetical protein D9M68_823890 [compost metagenome]